MSSNKTLRISLKIRLALLYTLLFFISCSMIFVVASLRIYREVNRMGDDELLRIADNIQEIYTNALNPPNREETEDPRNDYPENERRILEQRFPGMELLETRKQDALSAAQTRHYFTAAIFHKGNFYECRVRHDGTVYSKQLKNIANLKQLYAKLHARPDTPEAAVNKALKRHFNQLGRIHGQNDFFVVIRDKENQKNLICPTNPAKNKILTYKRC